MQLRIINMEDSELKWEKSSEELKNRLYKELGMTRESSQKDVETLKLWLSKQPHLPKITDDHLLKSFLFNSKNSLEKAKSKLDQYYTVRVTMPEYFGNRDPADPSLQKHVCYVVLPKLTKKGHRVVLIKLFDMDPENFRPLAIIKCALMLLELIIKLDVIEGVQLVFDADGFTLAHAAAVTFRIAKTFVQCSMSAYPQRFKGFHVINSSPIVMTVVNLFKTVLKEKDKKKIYLHGRGETTLFNHIEKEVIPKEFGGVYPHSIQKIRDLTIKVLVEHRQYFLEEQKIKADLSKKLGDINVQHALEEAQLFGTQGSFRNMSLD